MSIPVKWPFPLTFWSKSADNAALQTGSDCATVRPPRRRRSCLIKDCTMTSLARSATLAPLSGPHRTRAALAALALLILPVVAGCSKDSSQAAADPNDPVLARVNGTEIRQSDLAIAEEDLATELHGAPPDVKREQLIAYLSNVLLVAQAAEKDKLGEGPEFKRRMAMMRNKLLMSALLQKRSREAATEEEMRKVYDEAVKQMSAEEEIRARHILVETEDEAKAIAAQIKDGADFATLAREKSKDTGSAANGGELEFMGKSELVPEFAEVAFKMYPGQTSNPVKTQFGWHIIRLDDTREAQFPALADVKPQIKQRLTQQKLAAFRTQLIKSAKTDYKLPE